MTREPWQIDLREDARATIVAETLMHLPSETGGILLGYREGPRIVITDACLVEDPRSSSRIYVRDDVEANAQLHAFLSKRDSGDTVGYVGEWHSHPGPSGPSRQDAASLKQTARGAGDAIALIVYAPTHDTPFNGLVAQRHRLGRIPITEAEVVLPERRFPPLGPLPADAVRANGPVFTSYRRSDGAPHADRLEDLQRAAGLVVWRDVPDLRGGRTIDRLEQALTGGLSGGLLIVTREIAWSDVVRERELPRLLQLAEDPRFNLSIANYVAGTDTACDYAAPDRLLGLTPRHTLADMNQMNMLAPNGEARLIRELVMHRIEQRKDAIRAQGRFALRIQSRPSASAVDADDSDLHIRVRPADHGRLPSSQGIDCLRLTLPITSDAIYASGAKSVTLSGGAHLSIGLALGASLPVTKGCKVKVLDPEGNAWAPTVSAGAPEVDLQVAEIAVASAEPTAHDGPVAVFVSLIDGADEEAFRRLVDETGQSFTRAVWIRSTTTSRIQPGSAAALVTSITREIRAIASASGRAELHLALHAPFPIAVLLGQQLNTLRTVVYEWDGITPTTHYWPVLTLEPGVTDGPIVETFPARP